MHFDQIFLFEKDQNNTVDKKQTVYSIFLHLNIFSFEIKISEEKR